MNPEGPEPLPQVPALCSRCPCVDNWSLPCGPPWLTCPAVSPYLSIPHVPLCSPGLSLSLVIPCCLPVFPRVLI